MTRLDVTALEAHIDCDGVPVSFERAFALLQTSAEFRSTVVKALRRAPFGAFYWEAPPVMRETLVEPFRYVLLDAPRLLHASPDPDAFAEHYADDADGDGVVAFENLSRDATLVVPCPEGSPSHCVHLAAFVRSAPEARVDALFAAVGSAMAREVAEQPLWLNTEGSGVAWVHVRLDRRPKYYHHSPYRNCR